MRNLPVPGMDALALFDKITGEKRGEVSARLGRLRRRISSAYASYQANTDALQTIASAGIKGVREKALLHAYNSPTATMRSIRDNLIYPNIEDFDECPYCGINDPKTLDHYLPKETYPEFAVHPLNLIPICHICNSHYKRSQFLDGGARLFMHSYFDTFPAFDFIQLQVIVNREVILSFTNSSDPANPDFSILFGRHFRKLGLNERFVQKSAAEISRKRPALRRFYRNGGAAEVAQVLQQEANDFRVTLSGNHWKVALYSSLAGSQDFCDGGFLRTVKIR
ncbi:HNH endonuclease [Janthinobacterium sp. NKUCC06_STL]|uniref:HNH endonuclease n=1 Tax=Janthinobacterium sp. NKUCC06_STL TaxID=2842127 RepID=UPI001C5AB434|nr:hypothetical protein [Janthinobacterium sp. NKUCC06_STL]MBW3510603.1 hypothetical protein [Janthinobacterium sp. NKUCC06_STL]